MVIQISAGIHPPEECCLAVNKFYEYLKSTSCSDASEVEFSIAPLHKYPVSITFHTDKDIDLNGTVQWICESPIRPGHKRKNWYIDVHTIPDEDALDISDEFQFETFRSGGKGGQHVNKTSSGVRAIHIPTGISVVCTEERSQFMNKKRAVERIKLKLAEMQDGNKAKVKNTAWQKHNEIIRGNPIMVFKGMNFKKIK